MDTLTILNYQGSKKNLLEFIHESLSDYIDDRDVILDIFSGTASVAYSYKKTNTVYANDAELYASTVAKALLGDRLEDNVIANVELEYKKIISSNVYQEWIRKEDLFIQEKKIKKLLELYGEIPTVWKTGKKQIDNMQYSLFVTYYSTSYFGIKQARDIDAIRQAIDLCGVGNCDILLSCLFFAMKECVFSKDGHMAQPLDLSKNATRLFKLRSKSIKEIFFEKLSDFCREDFIQNGNVNKVFNCNFEELLTKKEIQEEVTVIYADPPYTDMQYSRYYHLLNTVVQYDYPDLTENAGGYTKGLYLENRFQSQLSKKSTCLNSMEKLIDFSFKHNKVLAISFAYPQNTDKQKTDRYVMDIDDLINSCKKYYPADRVHVKNVKYEHSNNRNSEHKKVLEYLIICEREGR